MTRSGGRILQNPPEVNVTNHICTGQVFGPENRCRRGSFQPRSRGFPEAGRPAVHGFGSGELVGQSHASPRRPTATHGPSSEVAQLASALAGDGKLD